ncbi:hypothetical protein GY15_09475 [Delftia sp. 670]|nr:hypothetical protein GY15_09475 [Delftia sp. 670]KLO58598.1 hypothetical protein AA671_17555 [Delftia tsuruhatensis]
MTIKMNLSVGCEFSDGIAVVRKQDRAFLYPTICAYHQRVGPAGIADVNFFIRAKLMTGFFSIKQMLQLFLASLPILFIKWMDVFTVGATQVFYGF